MAVATEGFVITGERDDLLASLAPAERFVSKHGSNSAVQNVHLYVDPAGTGYVEATDLSMSVRTHLWASTDTPEIDVLVHPKIRRAVAALANGPVTLAQKEGEIEVTGKGRARYTVPLASGTFANAFPRLEDVDWSASTPVDATEALRAMAVASRFTAQKEQNPAITGVNLRVVKQALGIDATDGFRLYQTAVPLPDKGFPFNEEEVILPTRMIAELVKLFPKGEIIFAADQNLFFATDPSRETTFASRRVGGKFPDVDRMVGEYNASATIPREEFEKALGRLRTLAAGKSPVAVELEGDEVHLTLRGEEGEAEEWVTLPAPVQEGIIIGFNLEHLLSAVGVFDGDELTFSYQSALRPALFFEPGPRLSARFVVMPVRLT